MIGEGVVKIIVNHCVGDFDVFGKHLVKEVALFMRGGTLIKGWDKVKFPQLLIDLP